MTTKRKSFIKCIEKGCEATIPNSEYETMRRAGWGFSQRPDPGAEPNRDGSMGDGPFYACPDHKDE